MKIPHYKYNEDNVRCEITVSENMIGTGLILETWIELLFFHPQQTDHFSLLHKSQHAAAPSHKMFFLRVDSPPRG